MEDHSGSDSDADDLHPRAFAVPTGAPDYSIESIDDISPEEFLRRVAYVLSVVLVSIEMCVLFVSHLSGTSLVSCPKF
jgi:hypothetical protein